MIEKLVIFTDLDGTLLDKLTYQPGPALNTLQFCRRHDIPVVFVSAKTRSEIEPIRRQLNNESPFVCENGGGLYLPVSGSACPEGFTKSEDYWIWQSGGSIVDIREVLAQAAQAAGIEIKSFDQMTAVEIADLTGLDLEQAELAKAREFDEPFIIIDESPDKLQNLIDEIIRRGYRYNSGGYLHHITGNFDKGQTLKKLKNIYLGINPETKFVGLGDAYNDLPMLEIVDYPFLVRRPDGSIDTRVSFQSLTITDGIGPQGFAEAVESVMKIIGQN